MKITDSDIKINSTEIDIIDSLLDLDNKQILELGCGAANITRLIATAGQGRKITAAEVDKIQHDKNLLIDDLDNVQFVLAGAEDIPLDDKCVDVVFMFKSLHHIPENLIRQSFNEVNRVLKPGGYVYISEPVYDGDFNEILKMFHDEKKVREMAFDAIKKAVDENLFELKQELFFYSPSQYENFEQFEQRIIKATHTQHTISSELYAEIKNKFNYFIGLNKGNFLNPMRVDLLTKPVNR